MSRLKSENYIVIPAWATQEPYNLKKNELIVFSIIYGFCQHKGQCFCGSIAYLAEWANSTRQGVAKNLTSLVKKGFIRKEPGFPTNRYYINNLTPVYEPDEDESNNDPENNEELASTEGEAIIEDDYQAAVTERGKVEEVVNYLNKVCKTKFNSKTAITKKLIRDRYNEGNTLEDFKKVIDFKYQQWGVTPVKFTNGQMSDEYLRPTTLFGNNFENYLAEAKRGRVQRSKYTSVSVDPDEDRADFTF